MKRVSCMSTIVKRLLAPAFLHEQRWCLEFSSGVDSARYASRNIGLCFEECSERAKKGGR